MIWWSSNFISASLKVNFCWPVTCLGQHMSLSAVSRCPDVHGTMNLQQLWRQNLCSCWTSVVELTTSPAAQSRHQLQMVQMTADESSLLERWTWRSVTFDMQRHRKKFYLLTCCTTIIRGPQITQVHSDWSSQHGSESVTLEAAGYDWHYVLLVMQTRNDVLHL